MKKIVALFVLLMSVQAQAAFIETNIGYNNHGIRGSRKAGPLDLSFGYLNATNERSELSSNVDLHVIDLSIGHRIGLGYGLSAGVTGGIGYGIPNVHYGPDTADNDVAYLVTGGLEYAVSESISLGVGVKNVFFTTDVQRTHYGFHRENIPGLGIVEFVDIYHSNHRVNLDTFVGALTIKFRF